MQALFNIMHSSKRAAGRTAFWALLASAAALVAGCHGLPQKIDETAALPTNKLYADAQDAMNGRDWSKCAKYFDLVQGRDPFGAQAQQAQLNVAYCNWKDGEIDNADQAVDRFIKLHPDHPDIAYAYYLKGLIHFNDDLGLLGRFAGQDMSERDPQALRESYDAFKIVVDRYPQSKYATDAAARMRYVVNALASHEVHSAEYYYRRGAYVAAINRSESAIELYKNAPAVEDALHIMVLSYRKLNQPQMADDTQRVLASTFPNSQFLDGADRKAPKRSWWQF
jgi:outer membrane protein assembly factor BamD